MIELLLLLLIPLKVLSTEKGGNATLASERTTYFWVRPPEGNILYKLWLISKPVSRKWEFKQCIQSILSSLPWSFRSHFCWSFLHHLTSPLSETQKSSTKILTMWQEGVDAVLCECFGATDRGVMCLEEYVIHHWPHQQMWGWCYGYRLQTTPRINLDVRSLLKCIKLPSEEAQLQIWYYWVEATYIQMIQNHLNTNDPYHM